MSECLWVFILDGKSVVEVLVYFFVLETFDF